MDVKPLVEKGLGERRTKLRIGLELSLHSPIQGSRQVATAVTVQLLDREWRELEDGCEIKCHKDVTRL